MQGQEAVGNSCGRSVDETLAYRRRSLRTHPGTFLLGPTGARLWADYLEPVPGFVGRLDFIHKLNIPELFRVDASGLPPASGWDVTWRPSHLRAEASTGALRVVEHKFISWDDCAVSLQRWTNNGPAPVVLRAATDGGWTTPGSRFGTASGKVDTDHRFGVTMEVRSSLDHPGDSLVLAPGETRELVVAAALGIVGTDHVTELERRLDRFVGSGASISKVLDGHVREYLSWFEKAPHFRSSDPVLDRTWDYRWFLLRHNYAAPHHGNLPAPLFYEGRSHKMSKQAWRPEGWEFSKLIPLSSPMHLLEARWHADPTLGRDLWRNLVGAQLPEGGFGVRTVDGTGHSYANFLGWATYQYALAHPEFDVAPVLGALKRQVRGDHMHLTTGDDVLPVQYDHKLTGKEYQPSYWYFHDYPDDPLDPATYTPLKRVDRAVYHYRNAEGVSRLCRLADDPDAAEFAALAGRISVDILQRMWDPATAFFYDLHHRTGEQAMVRNVVGFYPYWAELTAPEHLPGLAAAFAPDEFGTAHPFPSVSPRCPAYRPHGGWLGAFLKGRNGCMWNGPTWPYTNGIVIDAIGATSRRFEHRYDAEFGHALSAYAALHFHQLDGASPYLVEHYDSSTGEPISDEADYLHSYFIDLVVRYVVGLEVHEDRLVVDPLDIGLEHFVIENLHVAGHDVAVWYSRDEDGLRIEIDGEVVLAKHRMGTAVAVPLPGR